MFGKELHRVQPHQIPKTALSIGTYTMENTQFPKYILLISLENVKLHPPLYFRLVCSSWAKMQKPRSLRNVSFCWEAGFRPLKKALVFQFGSICVAARPSQRVGAPGEGSPPWHRSPKSACKKRIQKMMPKVPKTVSQAAKMTSTSKENQDNSVHWKSITI